MEDIPTNSEADDLIDIEEPEGSEVDEDEDEILDEPLTSPLLFHLTSGPTSAATSTTSSPSNNDDISLPFHLSGKPMNIKRGRGRPKREGGKPATKFRTSFGGLPRMRRVKPIGLVRSRGWNKSFRQADKTDILSSYLVSSDDGIIPEHETGSIILVDKSVPYCDEIPYPAEQWPGKVCSFCNLGERSQLGQGDMLRLDCPENFKPQRIIAAQGSQTMSPVEDKDIEKGPKGPVTCRRQKSFGKSRSVSITNEYIDELSIIGFNEAPDVNVLFEGNGQFYVHRNCAHWSQGLTQTENEIMDNLSLVVLQSSSNKCSFCNHYGASIICKANGCKRIYHYPCAAASGAFQELKTLTVLCSNHISFVAEQCESAICNTCKNMGNIANLVYCSSCGMHYHGTCVGLAQLPGVRTGWQCRKCRVCQVCRIIGDESKLMTCEQCDKVYHSTCQRPIVTSIPKYGWKCRCCRICGDCGSRTPGAGLSSRWHSHYTVCDSCYQQRNKGYCCPVCHRAYRAHAHREMIQCTLCRKFVHGTCDPEADLTTYNQKKDLNSEYDYICVYCKNIQTPSRQPVPKRASVDDPTDILNSQELLLYEEFLEFDFTSNDDNRNVGFGKGKPYSANKLSKKRFSFPMGLPGRPKGVGKNVSGKQGVVKRQKLADINRKRGPKAKMRGIFGVPGVGLQRPISDDKCEEEPGLENKLILCSAKDKFVLTQDICVMCGALGLDQEGCLISCVQCGQCYHPYCINVKVTKVILQQGWRCLDCTVCEGCGQRNDESRLILCDDCDVSYHIYCMDPPLDYVPHGNWKCKWCAVCQTCGTTDPGFNCTWMNSFEECGPCASHTNCPSCMEPYIEGELIIQCIQCERWFHGACDQIKTEQDAEKCAQDGYNCILCRPRDVPPPHLLQPLPMSKPPTPSKSPDLKSNTNYFVDGIHLSEYGHGFIKSLSTDSHVTRKKRKRPPTVQDKEAGIMATIESVIAAGTVDYSSMDDNTKLEIVDVKDEPQELYKEGMIWTKDDGSPPEGFTIFTMDSGIQVLRRKRQRNLQKLGIGGFLVRARGIKSNQDNDDVDTLPGQSMSVITESSLISDSDKPKRKSMRRKLKCKLAESFPIYLQEAFFGKGLMDLSNKKQVDIDSSDDDNEIKHPIKKSEDNGLSDGYKSSKQNKANTKFLIKANKHFLTSKEDNTEDIKDVLSISGELLDQDLVNSIINDEDEDLTKNTETLEVLGNETQVNDSLDTSQNSKTTKDELGDILETHFQIEPIPTINGKDVEDIFKGVLSEDTQDSPKGVYNTHTKSLFENTGSSSKTSPVAQCSGQETSILRSSVTANMANINSPLSFPPPSPYSEYNNSPQFSPAFSEPSSPWVNVNDVAEIDGSTSGLATAYSQNQRSSEKMRVDEGLGEEATISAVLYANTNHPDWKIEFPNWCDRYKHIIKKWRTLSQDQKAPFLQKARDNRSQLRMKKAQHPQVNKEAQTNTLAIPSPPKLHHTPVSTIKPQIVPQPVAASTTTEDQEKLALQQKSAREAEQEKQWKQLQALRQQQAQQQQNVIHEQRIQAISRAQRQIAEPGNFLQGQQNSHQVLPVQHTSPCTSPSPRQFTGLKSPSLQQISPKASQHSEFSQDEITDMYGSQSSKPLAAAKQSAELYSQDGQTSKFISTNQTIPMQFEQSDVNRQLRDLIQKQHAKKEKLIAGKSVSSGFKPEVEILEREKPCNISSANNSENQEKFRQPLPPNIIKPRMPIGVPIRQLTNIKVSSKGQGIDPRMRLILQQQKLKCINPDLVKRPIDQTVPQCSAHKSTPQEQCDPDTSQTNIEKSQISNKKITSSNESSDNTSKKQEIPENVTAELEKLEHETTSSINVLHGVDILGGLEEDDELLAEMGADFNILEYADPELETVPGEKTNILDMELEEDSKDKKKDKEGRKISTSKASQQCQATQSDQVQQQNISEQKNTVDGDKMETQDTKTLLPHQ